MEQNKDTYCQFYLKGSALLGGIISEEEMSNIVKKIKKPGREDRMAKH